MKEKVEIAIKIILVIIYVFILNICLIVNCVMAVETRQMNPLSREDNQLDSKQYLTQY